MNEELSQETDSVANNEKTTKLGGITGKGFMPGKSGNPSGRPKGTLKDYVRKMFMEMSDDDKKVWLKSNKVSGIDVWKMGEGQPASEVELKGEVVSKIISVDE